MSHPTSQTVRLGKGSHKSPASGACVVELASMLAGERFSDHPRTVCPVIAGFLRTYNDLLAPSERDHLYPVAALVVGSASTRSVRRLRTVRLLEWAGMRDAARPPRRFAPLPARDQIVVAAAGIAFRLRSDRRAGAVAELVRELVAIGDSSRHEGAWSHGPAAPAPPSAVAAVQGPSPPLADCS
jgi:hypothetical protein